MGEELGAFASPVGSHSGPGGRTYNQRYTKAKDRDIEGHSKMSKRKLER